MIPQAGAIFAIRGVIPTKRADTPSARMMCHTSDTDAVDRGLLVVADINNAWRRVLRTSKGYVTSAAVVPLTAPLTKATHAPRRPRRSNAPLKLS